MNNDEIKNLIKAEKEQLKAFLKMAEKFQFSDDVVEKQINFYLEKLTELKRKLKEE
ncbi:MAG: hypothetical protein QM763_07885 [Agriterribacter sp.]